MIDRTLLSIWRAVMTVSGLIATVGIAQTTLNSPVGQFAPFPLDSGLQDNPTDDARVLWQTTVTAEGAAWLRVYFTQVDLPPGSVLAISSLLDGAVQHHDARTLAEWENTSAYFNGSAVDLVLVAGPRTVGNRVVVAQVAYEVPVGSVAGALCGTCDGDDRAPSDERFAGRLMPVGCSASIFNSSGCFVTAGHCLGAAFVMQFQVPLSNSNGSLNHPGPDDQYPVLSSTVAGLNGGVGLDWGYFECGANTETGLLAVEAQGDYRPIAAQLPTTFPVLIQIWGYGTSTNGVVSQIQQLSEGPLIQLESGFGSQELAWYHEADTTPGNSGSSILYQNEIIGIVTHCTGNCPNLGTPVNRPDFTAARGSCPPKRGDCDLDDDIDAADFAGFPACLTGPRIGPHAPSCECSDFESDTHIDLADYATQQNAYTGNLCIAPQFTDVPASQIVCEGTTAVLMPRTIANHTTTYQWLKNGEAIEGATSAALVIDEFSAGDAGVYTLVATNVCGATSSAPAMLSLCTEEIFSDSFEDDLGWTVESDASMIRGQWARAVPQLTMAGYDVVQPGADSPYDAGTNCFGTGPFGGLAVSNDVDGGPTVLYSPIVDLSGRSSLMLRYAYWFYRSNDDGADALVTEISNDGGETWTQVARHDTNTDEWRLFVADVPLIILPTTQVQLRFSVEDTEGETLLEGLIDQVEILTAD